MAWLGNVSCTHRPPALRPMNRSIFDDAALRGQLGWRRRECFASQLKLPKHHSLTLRGLRNGSQKESRECQTAYTVRAKDETLPDRIELSTSRYAEQDSL